MTWISVSPAETASRRRRLIWRVVLSRQSMENVKRTSLQLTRESFLRSRDRPDCHCSRRRFTNRKGLAKSMPQSYFFGCNGHEIVGIGEHQGFKAVAVAHIGERIGTGSQVAERAVKIVERGPQCVGQRHTRGHAIAEIDTNHFRIIFREEAVAALLIPAAQLVVVRNMSVMHGGQIGHRMRPERLRMAQVNAALRGQARMTDAVTARSPGDGVRLFKLRGGADLLDDLQLMAQAYNFGSGNVSEKMILQG